MGSTRLADVHERLNAAHDSNDRNEGWAMAAARPRTIDCIVGARPNFVKIAPIMRAIRARERPRGAADTHRPALRRGDERGLLRGAGHPQSRHQSGGRFGKRHGADGASDVETRARPRGATARSSPCRRRREFDRRLRARRREAWHSARACRGGPAQQRQNHARGNQPPRHRPSFRSPLHHRTRGDRQSFEGRRFAGKPSPSSATS